MEKINNIMTNVKFVTNDKSLSLEDGTELTKKYPYSKFQMSCVTVIGNLMKKLAKEKDQEFRPCGDYNIPEGKGAHPHYAIVAFEINSLIDHEKHRDISIKEIREVVENNNLIDYLEKKFPEEVDFSGISKENRAEISSNLNSFFNGYYGQEKRKFGIENNGLNLVLAYLINIMQEKIGEHIYLKQRPPTKSPKIDH